VQLYQPHYTNIRVSPNDGAIVTTPSIPLNLPPPWRSLAWASWGFLAGICWRPDIASPLPPHAIQGAGPDCKGAKWADTPPRPPGRRRPYSSVFRYPDVSAWSSAIRHPILGRGRSDRRRSLPSPPPHPQDGRGVGHEGRPVPRCSRQRRRTSARATPPSIMVEAKKLRSPKFARYWSAMGKTLTYCGTSGNGQLTKIVNQILVSITNLAVCEALTFARVSGLDPQKTVAAVAEALRLVATHQPRPQDADQ